MTSCRFFVAGLACALAAAACGGGDETATGSSGSTGGASGSGGTGGTGGAGGEIAPAFEVLWTRQMKCFVPIVSSSGPYLAPDATGGVALGGELDGACSLYGGPKVTSKEGDVVVTRLDAQGGHLAGARFGDSANQGMWADAFGAAAGGRLALGGFFAGTIDFGAGPLTAVSVNGEDAFVAVLHADDLGAAWSRSFALDGAIFNGHLDVDAQGGVVLAGVSVGDIDFGGKPLTPGDGAIYLARFDETGATTWSEAVGGPGGFGAAVSLTAVAVAPDGSFFVSGTFQGKLDFGDGALDSPDDFAPFIASFGATGALRFSHAFVGTAAPNGFALSATDDGGVLLGAPVSGAFDLGSGPLGAPQKVTGALAKLDAHGKIVWARALGGDAVLNMPFAAAPDGSITVAATFRGTARVGDRTFAAVDGDDVLLARLDAHGDLLAAQAFGGPEDQWVTRVAIGKDGAVFVSGIGPNLDGNSSSTDFIVDFVEKLAPLP